MTFAQVALEWGIILAVFGIIYSHFAKRYPVLREIFNFMKDKEKTTKYNQPTEVKKQIWPENRAMI